MESTLAKFTFIAAEATQDAVNPIIRAFEATPDDRKTWKPLEIGKNISDQLLECASGNLYLAEGLRNFAMPAEYPEPTAASPEEALAIFKASVEDVVSAIEGFPEDRLEELIQLSKPTPFRKLMLFSQRHMQYHAGQISYIQTLYGDGEMH